MKKIINVLVVMLYLFSIESKAQQTVKNLDNPQGEYLQSGFYYKDIDNKLNPYVGTWLYTDGTMSLKIKLEKREHYLMETTSKSYYMDMLVGEFEYAVNGTVIVNRIPLLSNTTIDNFDYSITSFDIMRFNVMPHFPEASPLIRHLRASYTDPNVPYVDFYSVLGVNNEIENEKLVFFFKRTIFIDRPYEGAPIDPIFPTGKYVLNKLP